MCFSEIREVIDLLTHGVYIIGVKYEPQSQAKFQSKSRTFFHSYKIKKLKPIYSFLLDF